MFLRFVPSRIYIRTVLLNKSLFYDIYLSFKNLIVLVCFVCALLKIPEEGIGLEGSCEPSDRDAGNQTQVL